MPIKHAGKVLAGAMVLAAFWGASRAHASVRKDIDKGLDKMQHALGWDTLNLKLVEHDDAGRPTLERDSNTVNKIERRTSYHKNGNRDSQTVIVTAKASEKTLFIGKSDWNEKGDLENLHSQDGSFNGDGRQMKGLIIDKKYLNGRLVLEENRKYSAATDAWGSSYKQAISYYDDGDMRERSTERPASDEKIRETWSEHKRALGRRVTTQKSNSSKGSWE